MLTQDAPWFGLPSHTPVQGEPGVPTHGAPAVEPMRQTGHGWVALPVTTEIDVSGIVTWLVPVERSSVPLAGPEKMFWTHVVVPPFGIGSGVPNTQPVFVHLNPGPSASVGPRVQVVPVHEVVKRLVAPSGVGPSATVDAPPPMSRPPQVRFLSGVPVPSVVRNVFPHTLPAGPVVKSRNDGFGPPMVVVVVDDVVLVVVLLVVGASDVDVEELVLVEVVELVDVVELVELLELLELDVELLDDVEVVVLELVELDELVVVLPDVVVVDVLVVVTVVLELGGTAEVLLDDEDDVDVELVLVVVVDSHWHWSVHT